MHRTGPNIYPISLFTSLAFFGAASLSTPSLSQDIGFPIWATESSDTVYWKGEAPCDNLFETPVPQLPGGSRLTQILGIDDVQGNYAMSGGGSLRVTFRQPQKMPVQGVSYSDAIADLFKRKPLQDSIARKTSKFVVLADVKSRIGMSGRPYKLEDGSGYGLKPKTIRPSLNAKVRVADWPGYAAASVSDQQKWDGHLCENSHHELGHILVAAQILEEAEPEMLGLRGATPEELSQEISNLLSEIGKRINARQEAYHDEIKSMGRALSDSRPYLELPFPWLATDNPREDLTP